MRGAIGTRFRASLVSFLCSAGAALTALSVVERTAQAEPPSCGQTDQTWVNVKFVGRGWNKKLSDAVMAELKADLAGNGIAVCVEAASAILPPVAVVEIIADDPSSVLISIQVRDKVTAKQVGRDTDLGALPADGRPLAVAAAADELLRVTWAELALRSSHPPAIEPPEAVLRAARETLPVAPSNAERLELGARMSVAHFGGGQTQLGPDGYVRATITPRLATEIAMGGRSALAVKAPHGTIRSHALVGSLGVVGTLYRSAPLRLEVDGGFRGSSVSFEADPVPTVQGSSVSAMTISGYVAAGAAVRIVSGLRFNAAIGVGGPLRSASATDDGQVVSGVTGVEVFGNAGLSLSL
jgi:hypothetical protein